MKMINGTLLIVDDDKDVLQSANLFLSRYFKHVHTLEKPTNILSFLSKNRVDLLLLDMNFRTGENSGDEGLSWIRRVKEEHPQIEIITMTAYGDIDLAVKSMRYGASEFLTKPWDNNKLLTTVSSIMQLSMSKQEITRLRQTRTYIAKTEQKQEVYIQGRSKEIRQIKEMVSKVADTDANVLITGENGSGKDLVARLIHEKSARREEAFIVVDCGAITESLFESEMFGAVKGAYTDLNYDKKGRFEMAKGGTLFLDEIGNLSQAMQSKLLTALQNRVITPLGSSQEVNVDIRVISATNVHLGDLVDVEKFRMDLLYRINTVEINVPPLRHRPEDILPLANHFLEFYTGKYNKGTKWIVEEALEELISYPWPGNIRELRHAIERAVILNEASGLTANDILPGRHRKKLGGVALGNKEYNLDQMERKLIVEALESCGGNITKTAKALGITRTALYRRIDKYDLH